MEKIKAGVIGFPIKHSLSPKLHRYWLKKYNLHGEYNAIEVNPEDLENFLENFKESGLSGINITIPHKETAYKIIKRIGVLSNLANKLQAINTLYIKDGELFGTNTDYYGFKHALFSSIANFSFTDKRILVIGAGGAAKAIIGGLVTEKTGRILVINRSIVKLDKLKEIMNNQIDISGIENIEEKINQSDIVINATSCGLNGENNLEIDFSKIEGKKIFYDIVYKPLKTKFLDDAEKYKHKIVTGIGMLLYQAVPAFEFFYKKLPEVTKEQEQEILK